jgi:hypothetical protein
MTRAAVPGWLRPAQAKAIHRETQPFRAVIRHHSDAPRAGWRRAARGLQRQPGALPLPAGAAWGIALTVTNTARELSWARRPHQLLLLSLLLPLPALVLTLLLLALRMVAL